MTIDTGFSHGQVINNEQLCAVFKCSTQGGMRRSLTTNSLVLVSNHVASIYDDRWIGDTFHYTGMGQQGNQSLSNAQNKTLKESRTNGVAVHLFEVDREREYRYQGEVELASDPYPEIQPDQLQVDRTVWVFPLRLKRGAPAPLSTTEYDAGRLVREKKAKRLTAEELATRAQKAPKQAGQRTVVSTQFERNPYVSMLAKQRANGTCELCKSAAPFKDATGGPYLETHHIEWLARGGEDSVQNTVALCPNCHRKMHIVDDQKDRELLRLRVSESVLPPAKSQSSA